MSKVEWPARLTAVIAREVRRHRKARGLSVRQLSDAVERHGLAMAQPVLSNLELGRRETVSADEVLALGAALAVPPLLLMFPVGQTDPDTGQPVTMEPLIGVETSPWEALQWASGERALPGHPDLLRDGTGVIERFHAHQLHIDDLLGFRDDARGLRAEAESAPDPEAKARLIAEAEDAERHADRLSGIVRRERRAMREANLVPPPLPRALQSLDREPS